MHRILLLLLLATPAFAESLHWTAIDVEAEEDVPEDVAPSGRVFPSGGGGW